VSDALRPENLPQSASRPAYQEPETADVLSEILDHLPEGVATLSADGRVVSVFTGTVFVSGDPLDEGT